MEKHAEIESWQLGWGELLSADFWTQHDCCMHKCTAPVATRTISAQDQSSQNYDISGRGPPKAPPMMEKLSTVDSS